MPGPWNPFNPAKEGALPMTAHLALWQRHDTPGVEACRVDDLPDGWQMSGTAVCVHDGRPCRLDYRVVCDPGWRTVRAAVDGWVGTAAVRARAARRPDGQWRFNGRPRPGLAGCLDIDLHFSPATNLLPIRRLDLAVGQSADVAAAWLRFPEFTLEVLEQRYTRLAARRYRYASAGGRFTAELTVDAAGLVMEYARLWTRLASA